MNSRKKPSAGFSILELLIALALLALIAAGLASTLGVGARVWERSLQQHDTEDYAVLRTQLRNWIMQAVPPTHILPFDHPFIGNSDAFSFVTLAELPSSPDAAALKVSVQTSEAVLLLVISYLNDDGTVIRSEERELSKGIMRFAYYDKPNDTWLSEWTDLQTLPDLIQVESVKQNDSWPEFTVAPRF